MTIDVFGPANATDSTTSRPYDGRIFTSADTYFKDCTNEDTEDGTDILAGWLNQITGTNRALARANGFKLDGVNPVVAQDNADDLVLRAIQALIQRGQISYGTNAGTGDAAVVALTPVPAELVSGMEILVFYGAANTTTTPVANVGGTGNKSVVRQGGGNPAAGDLIAFVPLVYDGTKWRVNGSVASDATANPYIRPRLQGNLNLYVATTGNDSNPGTSASPYLTLQAATNYARSVDTAGYSITVNASNGTYSGAGVILAAPLIGGGSLSFVGNPSSPASVIVSNTQSSGNVAAFDATGGAQIFVNGFTVKSTNGPALFAQGAGSVVSYQNMVFDYCPNGAHVSAFGGGQCIIQAGTYSITNNALYHFYATQGGTIYNNAGGITIGVGAGITVTAFVYVFLGGTANLPSITFTGSNPTGYRYQIVGGMINTGGVSGTYFPGTVSGTGAVTSGAGQNYF